MKQLGMIGLGVMGASLARNFARHGVAVVGYDRDVAKAREVAARYPDAKITVADSLESLVKAMERPRRIVVLVVAGKPVDAVLDGLDPLLEEGDVVVDAGNSLYTDSDRRAARAGSRPWRFMGMGVSGGEEGALWGPSMMPGGDRAAWESMRDGLEAVAARSESGPCVTYCGAGSAGHFVKMVHNGIEYGDMQLIAEVTTLLREGMGVSAERAADVFARWNEGELQSYLVEITADILRVKDADGSPLVDAILDKAGQKGTGRWTVIAAAELGVAIPTIAAAVDARVLSSQKGLRVEAAGAYGARRGSLSDITEEDLGDALYGAKIASYTQGFQLLAAASEARGYGTSLPEVARVWTAGCIIRARFLDRVRAAFARDPAPALLALSPDFVDDLRRRLPAWRKVVAAAAASGYTSPGLSASLSWLDTLTAARGSASMIQAQRDYFGAHTYERLDAPGVAVHTRWSRS